MANKRDPQKLALHFHNNDEPAEDMQGVQELMQRWEKSLVILLFHKITMYVFLVNILYSQKN